MFSLQHIGYNSIDSNAEATKMLNMQQRLVQKSSFYTQPSGKTSSLQENLQTQILSQIQQVNKGSHRHLNTYHKTIPIFNKDKRFYTPTYILQQQQNFYRDNHERLKQSHMDKLKQSSQTQSILVPKHGRKKNYCNVCRQDYQDYIIHIQSDLHKKAIHCNRFSAYIMELTFLFKKVQPIEQKKLSIQDTNQVSLQQIKVRKNQQSFYIPIIHPPL